MKVGDKVKLTYDTDVTGILSYVSFERRVAGVIYDDPLLIPGNDSHPFDELIVIKGSLSDDIQGMSTKCECGQSDESWVKHSDYCPLNKEKIIWG